MSPRGSSQGFVDAEGDIVDAEPSETREVVTPAVAAESAADDAGAWSATPTAAPASSHSRASSNFSVAGKTGTGLKAQPDGGYLNAAGERVYYASFVGFFPAEDPQVTVLVSIDEPPAAVTSTASAAPPPPRCSPDWCR